MATYEFDAKLTADTSQFSANVQRAAQNVDALLRAAERANNSLDRMSKPNMGGLSKQMDTAARASAQLDRQLGAVNRTGKNGVYIRGLDTSASQLLRAATAAGVTSGAFRDLMLNTYQFTAAAAAGFALGGAIKTLMDFEVGMSKVAAATEAGSAELAKLSVAARSDTVVKMGFSATQAAEGMTELAKAGLTTQDILNGGLKGALSLAAAGNMKVGDAAGLAASAVKQFGLEAKALPYIADLLAAGANAATGEVHDMALALKQSGTVANQMGLSVQETVVGLTAFAKVGQIGSDAGTSFKTMLIRLANPTKKSSEYMQALGITAFDAQGQFVGLEKFAGSLNTSLAGMSTQQRNAALATIFGSDAIRAAGILTQAGAEKIREYTAEVAKAGYAENVARVQHNNLRGDLDKLQAAFNNIMISQGGGFLDFLRSLAQLAGSAVQNFDKIPTPILAVGAALAIARMSGSSFTTMIGNQMSALGGWATKFRELGGVVVDTETQIDKWNRLTAVNPLEQSAAKTKVAMDNLRVSMAQNANSFNVSTQAGQANAKALLDARDAAHAEMSTLVQSGAARTVVLQRARELNTEFGRLAPTTAAGAAAFQKQTAAIREMAELTPRATQGTFSFGAALRNAGGASGIFKNAMGGLVGALGGPWGLAIGAASLAMGAWINANNEAAAVTQKHKDLVTQLANTMTKTGHYTDLTAKTIGLSIAENEAIKSVEKLGFSQAHFTEAIIQGGPARDTLVRQLDEQIAKWTDAGRATGSMVNGYQGTIQALGQARAALTQHGDALTSGSQKAREQAEAQARAEESIKRSGNAASEADGQFKQFSGTVSEQEKKVKDLIKSIKDLGDALLDSRAKNRDFQESIDSAAEALKKNGATLDITTKKGRENQAALDNVAKSAREVAAARMVETGSHEEAAKAVETGRVAFIKAARQFGMNKAAAEQLADSLKITKEDVMQLAEAIEKTPASKKITMYTDARDAKMEIEELARAIAALKNRTITVDVDGNWQAQVPGYGGQRKFMATGGPVFGPGTTTSDSIPAMLSNDEHVLTAREVQRMGGHANVYRLRALALRGELNKYLPGFKDGGPVGRYATGGAVTGVADALVAAAVASLSVRTGTVTKALAPIVVPIKFNWNAKDLDLLKNDMAKLLSGYEIQASEASRKIESGFDRVRETIAKAVKDPAKLQEDYSKAQATSVDALAKLKAAQVTALNKANADVKKLTTALTKARNDITKQGAQLQAAQAALTTARRAKKRNPSAIAAARTRIEAETRDIQIARTKANQIQAQLAAATRGVKTSTGTSNATVNAAVKKYQQAKAAAEKARKEGEQGAKNILAQRKINALLDAMQPKMDAIANQYADATKAVEDQLAVVKKLQDQYDQYVEQVRSQALSRGSLKTVFDQYKADIEKRTKEIEDAMVVATRRAGKGSAADAVKLLELQNELATIKSGGGQKALAKGIQDATAKTTAFMQQVQRLKSMGLGDSLVKQVIDQGVGDGSALADAIEASGVQGVQELNTVQRQLEDAAQKLATVSGNAMYGAGLEMGNQMLRALQQQQAQIKAQIDQMVAEITAAVQRMAGVQVPTPQPSGPSPNTSPAPGSAIIYPGVPAKGNTPGASITPAKPAPAPGPKVYTAAEAQALIARDIAQMKAGLQPNKGYDTVAARYPTTVVNFNGTVGTSATKVVSAINTAKAAAASTYKVR